jgi:uncharacterized protein (DUF433 family)
VELILRKLSQRANISDLLQMYPHLRDIQMSAIFEYVADLLANQEDTLVSVV